MPDRLTVQVKYFASLREAIGPGEVVPVPRGSTVGALRDELIDRGEPYAGVLGRERAVRAALDQRLCAETEPLHEGAEVAFFPPVTGG
jgi:molybdopterin synthase sulfur carrier subunit